MKKEIETIINRLSPIAKKLRRYRIIILLAVVSLVYALLIIRINALNSQEPTDAAISDKLQTVTRPKIDQATIDKIKQLQDNSADVKSLFNNARENPFQE